ncbi:MAG: helix-turn-helix transcriptional regulator [Butyrivibrio sp.]|uniref:helix-turn-helix domain-containing protein n=1 Tax=Butyrivibrio sp. TaxID=28121 RepID=UPI001B015890|nr:helix-turn-helix transcriptional regulator [Butyrivibrio sp.]MBO6240688.1 helix-turn-helix transcriptional regulator [Butyrivibrio sp.]
MIDDIKFHAFMKMTREAAGVSLEEAGKGLYTKSMMAQIEKGTTLPDYMMRNRIMSRLGISSEGYEDFLQPDEYKRYLKRMELIKLIEARHFIEAEEQIDQVILQNDEKLNKLELQFYYDMKGRCLHFRKASWEEIFEMYQKACSLTMLLEEVNEKRFGVWATLEYFLLFKMLEAKAECSIVKEESSEIADVCLALLNHLEVSTMDVLGKAKVYTAGVVALGKIAHKNDYAQVDKKTVLEQYDKALDYLKQKSRSYYIAEILSGKISVLEELGNEEELKKAKEIYDLFAEVYSEYDVDYFMDYNCYIYRDSDIYCIGDVIKSRRQMLKISREELADRVKCSYRTLMRIENSAISAQKAVLRPIMDELNINCDYTRSDIITDDREVVNEYYSFANMLNNYVAADYEQIYTELEKRIDFSYTSNKQLWDAIKLYIIMGEGKITEKQYTSKLKEDMTLTLPVPIMEIEDGYLSHSELNLLIDIAKFSEDKKDKEHLMEYLQEFCSKHESGGYPVNYGTYETVMIWLADEYSDVDRIEKVEEIARELLILELKSHRLFDLHGALFMLLRNNAKIEERDNEYYKQSIDKMIRICDFINNSVHKEYYTLIKEMIEKKEDWKHY